MHVWQFPVTTNAFYIWTQFTGVKPFVCNECGLQFANKSNWQRHVAEHSGSRNYRCHLCEKKFSRNYYLSDHLKTHTGETPFVCGICGKSAATRSNYNSHLRTHITREPVNSEVWTELQPTFKLDSERVASLFLFVIWNKIFT